MGGSHHTRRARESDFPHPRNARPGRRRKTGQPEETTREKHRKGINYGNSQEPEAHLALAADLNAVKAFPGTFTGFQTLLEGSVHAGTHNAVGGDMKGSASPTDPLFWLHHSFIDKTWADWQASPNGKNPPNPNETLKPASMQSGVKFGVKVSTLLSIATLAYSYV